MKHTGLFIAAGTAIVGLLFGLYFVAGVHDKRIKDEMEKGIFSSVVPVITSVGSTGQAGSDPKAKVVSREVRYLDEIVTVEVGGREVRMKHVIFGEDEAWSQILEERPITVEEYQAAEVTPNTYPGAL